jgi:hypothetical protein
MRTHLRRFVLAPFDEAMCIHWAEADTLAAQGGYRQRRCLGSCNRSTPFLWLRNIGDYTGVANLALISER